MPPIRLKPDGTNLYKLICNAVLSVSDLDSPVVSTSHNYGRGANAGGVGAERIEGAKIPPPVIGRGTSEGCYWVCNSHVWVFIIV